MDSSGKTRAWTTPRLKRLGTVRDIAQRGNDRGKPCEQRGQGRPPFCS